jgi:hypothetical protein
MKFHRVLPYNTNDNPPMVIAQTQRVTSPRLARNVRTGWQGGMGRQHVPSGNGPSAHGPPSRLVRVHRHRLPSLTGWHSNVA